MQEYIEVGLRRSTKSKRIILTDRATGVAFISFDPKSFQAQFLENTHAEKIVDFKPVKI